MLVSPLDFFDLNKSATICLDEVQSLENIFVDIKASIEEDKRNSRFIVLGSASPDLLRQSAESLAGRIAYVEMGPFVWEEIKDQVRFEDYWLRGGYPDSLLKPDEKSSKVWRQNYIRTFIERDLNMYSLKISSVQISRLYEMLSYIHGKELNIKNISNSLASSYHTVRSYLDILQSAYQIMLLQPYPGYSSKRLIKSPKVYILDSGILHSFHNIESINQLFAHPIFGPSFEGLIIYNLKTLFPDYKLSYYKTSNGAEVDLILENADSKFAIEIKASSSPQVSRGFWSALEDINPTHSFIVSLVKEAYAIKPKVRVSNLNSIAEDIKTIVESKENKLN
jgi:predicted AAA+ superfamily ATPase